jgi:hypothetical protein
VGQGRVTLESGEQVDAAIALSFLTYYAGDKPGDREHLWALTALDELAIDDPLRAWKIIGMINATPVGDPMKQEMLYAVIGCGPLEEVIALHTDVMLPKILEAARSSHPVRAQLSEINEDAVSPEIWAEIQAILA